jgi:hypothetical protein
MPMKDLNVAEISGFMGLVMIPWGLKFFFAPFMDRFSFLSLGRRRILGHNRGDKTEYRRSSKANPVNQPLTHFSVWSKICSIS